MNRVVMIVHRCDRFQDVALFFVKMDECLVMWGWLAFEHNRLGLVLAAKRLRWR